MTDWRDRVLSAMPDASSLCQALSELVRVPSVSGSAEENDAQHLLAKSWARDGLDVECWPLPLASLVRSPDFPGWEVPRREAWGLVGRLPGRLPADGRSLLLLGHVDVVPPGDVSQWASGDPYSARVDGGVLYGRGSCDMKAGLTAAAVAVAALRRARAPLRGDVLLASVQGEEDGGLGAFGLLERGYRADACVIPEPTSLDLVPAAAGALTFRLRVPGRAAHAARRTAGVSAVEKLWPVWRALAALERRRNADVDPLMRRWPVAYPLSLGTVRAGQWASTVPDECVAEGRLGVALGEPVEAARAELEAAVAQACGDDPWLREHPVAVEWWGGQFAPGQLPAGSDLLERVGAAHVAAGSRRGATYGVPYGSDLRLLTGLGGIPTVHYGPGDAGVAHGPDESVPIAEVVTAARALALLAIDVCGVA